MVGQTFGGEAATEVEDPTRDFSIIRLGEHIAVDIEKGEHRQQRSRLIAVYENLSLRDAMSKYGGLQGNVRTLVMRIHTWPVDRGGKAVLVAQLIRCVSKRTTEVIGKEVEDICDGEVEILDLFAVVVMCRIIHRVIQSATAGMRSAGGGASSASARMSSAARC